MVFDEGSKKIIVLFTIDEDNFIILGHSHDGWHDVWGVTILMGEVKNNYAVSNTRHGGHDKDDEEPLHIAILSVFW